MSGDEACKNIFNSFTKPHPRYKLIQNKRWGIGLISLPDHFQEYLKGKNKQVLRTNRRRAISLGFRFDSCKPLEHVDEILSINTSVQIRQGSPMNPDYLSVERLREFFEDKPMIYGVFNADGVLRTYAHTPISGELFIFSRLLGHAEDLDKGIMYLLMSEVIRQMIERKLKHGAPSWAMYDTFFGGLPGLRYFKERLGFKPYKVRWLWKPEG